MAQTIQIKRSTGSNAPTSLANGELAYVNHSSLKKLYIGRPGGNSGDIDVIGGKDFVDKLDGIEAGATADQTASEIRTLVESASDSNVFTNADHTKLNNIAANANNYSLPIATDTALGGIKIGTGLTINSTTGVVTADEVDSDAVEAAGALMDSEVTNLAQVKAFDSSDYATAAQGTKADNALPKAGGTMTGDLSFGDSKSIKMGASNDLQIVHSPTGGNLIVDNGAGVLKLVTNGTGITIAGGGTGGGSSNADLAIFHSNTSAASGDQFYVQLNYNGGLRFRTNSSGVGVTGDIAVTGDVDGRDIAADGSKLDGISAGADVTPSWVPSSNPNYITFNSLAGATNVNFSNITITGDTIKSGSTLTLDPEAHVGDSGAVGTVVIEGDLRVKGTTTTVDSNTVSIGDAILLLNSDQSATNATSTDDAGLEVKRGTSSSELNAFLVWDESADRWSVDPGTGTLSPLNVENVAIDGGTF